MTVGSLAVKLPVSQSEDEQTQWLNLLAFGQWAEDLAKAEPRSNVSVMGRLQFSRYEKDGEEKTVLQMVADNVLTVRTSRPKGGRKPNKPASQNEFTGEFQEPWTTKRF